ncbi:5-formyltetrahydrofolate cyclo-ligase [Salinispirillum marinum]|uniref:5-formyltetrahydrofolate cyclo-ligase n=2 Tax=Saccharospirillaceae TaxID=255527 RepID=A0ABV8BBU1_9GAMM
MSNTADRIQLRRELRARRRGLSEWQQRHAALRIARRLQHHPWVHQAQHIALYLSNDGEVSLQPLIHLLWLQNKHVYLPVVHPLQQRMRFALYRRHSLMRRNRFDIPEPRTTKHRAPYELDLVLLPLVGFDALGQRLGMGGGFYDRTFARRGMRPLLLGIAHTCQQVARLPNAPWDVPLNAIVTDTAWISPRRPHVPS